MTELSAIEPGALLVVEKGCSARGIRKGMRVTVRKVYQPWLGETAVRVALQVNQELFHVAFYVRSPAYLRRELVAMNDGNPAHRIVLRRA